MRARVGFHTCSRLQLRLSRTTTASGRRGRASPGGADCDWWLPRGSWLKHHPWNGRYRWSLSWVLLLSCMCCPSPSPGLLLVLVLLLLVDQGLLLHASMFPSLPLVPFRRSPSVAMDMEMATSAQSRYGLSFFCSSYLLSCVFFFSFFSF